MIRARSSVWLWLLVPGVLAGSRATFGDGIAVEPIGIPTPFLQAQATGQNATSLDVALEASAVEPIGDGSLILVAHDKQVPLRVFEAATGRAIGQPLTSPGFPAETPKSAKWESMARDSDGNYYLAGSHSGKTDDERKQHGQLLRFRLKAESACPEIQESSVVNWRFAGSLVQALQADGLSPGAIDERKVEGLAIRESSTVGNGKIRRQLVIGLRQPDDLVRAYAADISTPPAPNSELPLQRLFAFDPGQREGTRCQLTSLEYLPEWKGFLLITATEDAQNVFHGNTLWFIPDERIDAANGLTIHADMLLTFEVAMKAEGLCILPASSGPAEPGAVRVLITYDNDQHITHIPSRYQILKLVRHAHSSTSPEPDFKATSAR